MTEDEARAWLTDQFSVSRETWALLERYVSILLTEMSQQNLIAESTRPHIWARHIVDSAQLLTWADGAEGAWIDLGSGAGLPAVVISILSDRPVTMIETRRKRVEFLHLVVDELGLRNAHVHGGRVEAAPPGQAAVISARAYAPLPKLLQSAFHLSTENTLWILPKGRNAENELEATLQAWQGVFHVERSVTDAESAILLGRNIKPKVGKGRK